MGDGVVSVPDNEGTKRRLPLWMMGVVAADQVRKSEVENKHVNNNSIEEGIEPELVRSRSKSKARTEPIKRGISLPKHEPSGVNSSLLVKCGMKRRRRKLSPEEDACSDGEVRDAAAEKKRSNRGGRKSRKCAQKQQKAESLKSESSEEIEAPSPGDDNGELTVDDLMSIAHEYIGTDEHTEQKRSSHREQEVERQFPAISLDNASQSNTRSPTHNEIVSVHNSTETYGRREAVVNPGRTGDPAQDMLDLFLGPLLKKPPGVENKNELIKEEMTLAYEIERQKKNNITKEDVVPLTKKKSSLKGKVAMFLD